ncbi:hypothetical protein [Streptomyces chengmaiensis]|uniref:hypothetical protein n=1 Tax=Streptomyces chengmaiensis TaxID=3040919 RepID=UPI002448751A|nr:hypothetical protein [Streptomyces chengmaiensis]
MTGLAQRLDDVPCAMACGNRSADPELAFGTTPADDATLTARKPEVLRRTADGVEIPEIAERARPPLGAVRNHSSSTASKPGAESRHAAMRLARERGWV